MPDELDVLASQLTESLVGQIATLGSALIAFSGGVDSSLVAALAARALGDQALAVTAVSPALASGELDGARSVARAVGVRHEVITTAELEREDYRRNDRFRCYYCKSELYERLAVVARRRGFASRAQRDVETNDSFDVGPAHPTDAAKQKVIKDFLNWMLDHGESEVSGLDYAPLPEAVQVRVLARVKQIQY